MQYNKTMDFVYQHNTANTTEIDCGLESYKPDTDRLLRIEPESAERLTAEIMQTRQAGYEVRVGDYTDSAYQNPSEIRRVYEDLVDMDQVLYAVRKRQLGWNALGKVTGGVWSRPAKELYSRLEPTRNRLLFDPYGGGPWHDMRGSALALETIVAAPRLKVEGSHIGSFPTMSGELGDELMDTKFGDNAGNLEGLGLFEATAVAEILYRNKTEKDALSRAEKRLKKVKGFVDAPVSQEFKDVVEYCVDGLGIRSRGAEVGGIIRDHVDNMIAAKSDNLEPFLMMSYGCGTARTIIDAAAHAKSRNQESKIVLVDQDPIALAAASTIAKKSGLNDDEIEIHCIRLFDGQGRPADLGHILNGRELDIAEDSGLREYLPDNIYTSVTAETWRHLRRGGLMSTGNMNKNRPQSEFLHGMMGWFPRVRRRSIRRGFALHEKAGVPKGKTKSLLTRDGVYTLFLSVK